MGSRRSPADSALAAAAAESVAAARDEWNVAEVTKRLTEAGLVVTDSGESARHPALQTAGRRLHVSGSELQLYVYRDADARVEDGADLDTTQTAGDALTPPGERPRFIVVNNLIAILHTPSDRLAERVENVLTARHLREAGAAGGQVP